MELGLECDDGENSGYDEPEAAAEVISAPTGGKQPSEMEVEPVSRAAHVPRIAARAR